MNSLMPADPSQILDEHKRRTTIDKCLGYIHTGARSGKSLGQRLKGALKGRFGSN